MKIKLKVFLYLFIITGVLNLVNTCKTFTAYSEGEAVKKKPVKKDINWSLRMSRVHKSRDTYGLWIWNENNDSLNLLNNKDFREDFFNFCDAPHGYSNFKIRTLYFSIGANQKFTAHEDGLRDFLKDCHKRGYLVHACEGVRKWGTSKLSECWDYVESFIDFNRGTDNPELRYDGLQLDVEPFLTKEWKEMPDAPEKYIAMLKGVKKRMDSCGMDLANGHAIPVWYNNMQSNYMERVIDTLDYVALMDYFDSADRQVMNAREEIEYAEKTGKKVIIGSETMDLETVGFGAASSTYFEEGVDFMMKEQQKIQEHYTNADKKAFGGIAFHYLKDFRQLPMDFRRTVKDAGDRPFTVSLKKTAAKKIDGVLTDWPAKPTFKIYRKADIVHPQKDPDWKDKNDLSCQAWVGWSKAGLYFAFKVQDNVILQKWQKNHLWQGDYVELQLDTELSRDYNDTGMSGDDFQFGFSPGNFKNLKAETFCFVPGLGKQEQKKIRQISKRTQTGYIIEVFIPKTVLKNINLTEGAAIGLNINPSDTDDVGHVQKIMMSTSRIRHRSNPTTFGKAVLVK